MDDSCRIADGVPFPNKPVLKSRLRAAGVVVWLCWPPLIAAQSSYFAGVLGGISTLSADGRSVTTQTSSDISLYKPENGPTFRVFAGRHLTDYVSVEGNYGWNRNSLTLTASQTSKRTNVFYEQSRRASQHSVLGELLVYFRKRKSRVRPYLSVGGGVVHVASTQASIGQVIGTPELAPGEFSSTEPALRVAVGIDVFLKGGWAFRFTFSETIRQNAISAQLRPPGERNLANFQNLFGVVKYF